MHRIFGPSFFVIWGLVIVIFVIAYRRGDGGHWRGVKRGLQMFLINGPRIMVALLAAGFLSYILPKEHIAHWLGAGSGIKGILIGCAVGPFFPGGPLVIFPVIVALIKAGAAIPPVVAFLSAASTWGLHRMLMYEFPLMGSWFVATRILASLILPPLAGLITGLLVQVLGTPTLGS